ncbi:MAG: DUF4270 family protein, partial [Flavobacteriales bacterium]
MTRPAAWVVLLCVVSIAFAGCKKPDDDLGLDLLPGDPLGLSIDTITLRACTFEDTSIRTSGLTRHLLGSYLDPQFGLVKAGIVAQIRLSANNVGVTPPQDTIGLAADSMVLALAFDGINFAYGNLNPQVFQVFELSESLSIDSGYRTDHIPQVLATDLVAEPGRHITPEPFREPYIGGDSLAPQLRIKLDQHLAERFLNAFNTPDFTDNTTFLEFFKGVYIAVNNGPQLPFQEGILYFNLLSSATKVTLYYRDTVNEPEIPRSFDFLINTNSVRYTVVEHDRSQATDPALEVALADTTLPAPLVYVQTLGGTRTAIRFPYLMEPSLLNRVLAKAELVVPVQGTFYPYYPPPTQLFLFRKDSADLDVFLPDQLAGIGLVGGNYDQTEREYRFNITRYVQGVLNGSIPNNGIELLSGSSGVTANRAVLAGPDRTDDPMRLR